jgi:hypothetical protein
MDVPLQPPLLPPIEIYIGTTRSGRGFTIRQYRFQSVTDNLMETDQEGDGGGRRGNLKGRMPEKGAEPTE